MPLLGKFQSLFGEIRVARSRDGSLSYFQNGCFHSQANRDGTSICGYIHVIHEIIRQSFERNVLIIGCAGGTLATMLRRLHCKVTVVDIDPLAFVLARRYFKLPGDVRCIRRDGIAYLRTTRKSYDAIVIDVFDADNGVPRKFRSEAFFHLVQDILSPHGVMIMNMIARDDRDMRADQVARHAQAAGLDITLFDWPGQKDRNTLIAGNMDPRTHIPSGREPRWITSDLRGIARRKPRKHAF